MILRNELEPDIKKAETLYSDVLSLIMEYDDSTADILNRADRPKMISIIEKLSLLTNKRITDDDLLEYWGSTNIEDLAFSLALPEPNKVDKITVDEITEVKNRLKSLNEKDNLYWKKLSSYLFDKGVSFSEGLYPYYSNLLDRNVPAAPEDTIYL
tara:strand:+ start:1667 stop:2131 length:465 start_codon:yes stop_codon:yes gene_type:complete